MPPLFLGYLNLRFPQVESVGETFTTARTGKRILEIHFNWTVTVVRSKYVTGIGS